MIDRLTLVDHSTSVLKADCPSKGILVRTSLAIAEIDPMGVAIAINEIALVQQPVENVHNFQTCLVCLEMPASYNIDSCDHQFCFGCIPQFRLDRYEEDFSGVYLIPGSRCPVCRRVFEQQTELFPQL